MAPNANSGLVHRSKHHALFDHLIGPGRAAFWYTQRRRLASLRIGRIFLRQQWSLRMAKGTVKWFNPTKGYGFIQPAGGGGKDVFVHISAVEKAGLSTLNEGQTVEYEEVPNKGKTSAENLKVA
jgi:cold shock protein